MKNFVLAGAAGYIAPRHMKAIRETGNNLLAALDPNDSVGVIDSFFPSAKFFTNFESFDSYLAKIRRNQQDLVDYMAICSPNYMHHAHMQFALRAGVDAICEKPLVLNPEDIDELRAIQKETGRRVNTILQLRVHPSILSLKEKIQENKQSKKKDVRLTYITSRGDWYLQSWKGDQEKSGGIATNIGVHFFDMLHFIFGGVQSSELHFSSPTTVSGFLEYENARVQWFLSVDRKYIPEKLKIKNQATYRSITVDNEEVEFSSGFTDLHTLSYERVLAGRGFGLEDNRVAIETVYEIRNAVVTRSVDTHPFLERTNR